MVVKFFIDQFFKNKKPAMKAGLLKNIWITQGI